MEDEILLVDDDPDDADLFRAAAQAVDLTRPIRVARSGEEALDLLLVRRLSPALVLLDVKMPGVDGLEVLRRLRADPIFRNAVVVVLTGSDLESDRLEALSLGCNLFLTKPASLEGYYELARRIRSLLP